MFKTYIRLLGFAKPISRYAVPYFFFAALHAVFNTFNYAMIIPILNAMFSEGYAFQPLYEMPALSFKGEALQQWLNYFYTIFFGTEWRITNVLILLAVILIVMNLLSNLFRYLGGYTVENMRVTTVQRMRNAMFDSVICKDVGYFSDQRKGDIILHGKFIEDVILLKNKANVCIAVAVKIALRKILATATLDNDLAAGGRHQARDHLHQGRLTAAVGAQQGVGAPGLNGQRCIHHAVFRAEFARNVSDFKHFTSPR